MFYTPNYEMQPDELPGLGEDQQRMLRLWISVLRQGLQDWAEEQSRALPAEATHWFNSNEGFPGSFVFLCDLLNLDVEYARRQAHKSIDMLYRRPGQRFPGNKLN
jgi:hypothetical protein